MRESGRGTVPTVMKIRAWLQYAGCGAGLLLCGCGGGAPANPAPVASALAGNWLIVGPMPTNEFELGAPTTGFRLAMTFDVNGNNVVAGGFGSNSCGNVGGAFSIPSVMTGTIAADGGFSLQTQPNFPLGMMSIQGTVPKSNGAPWSGNYTVSFSPPFPTPPCQTSATGAFTATSFPLVNGVYAGTASATTSVSGVLTTTTMALQVALQQGGTETNPRGGTLTSNVVLTGASRFRAHPVSARGP